MILLTNLTGATGNAIKQELVDQKIPFKSTYRKLSWKHFINSQYRMSDLTQLRKLNNFLKDVTDIIHVASPRNDSLNGYIDELSILCELSKFWQNKMIYCSSQIVYQPSCDDELVEGSRLAIYNDNWYQIAKQRCEDIITSTSSNRVYTIYRLPIIVSDKRPVSFQLIDYYIECVKKNMSFYFTCSNSNASNFGTSWVYLKDLSKELLNALNYSISNIYNISSGYVSYIELIENIIILLNSKSRILFNSISGDVRLPHTRYKLNCSKLASISCDHKRNLNTILKDKIEQNHYE